MRCSMRNALVITAEGFVHGIDLGETSNDEYEAIRKAIGGGMVQCVPLSDSGLLLWCDDEGKLKGLPYNDKATAVWTRYWGNTDIMVGDIVVTGDLDWDSELTNGLTPEQVIELEKVVSHV